jgi:hypothetical protein
MKYEENKVLRIPTHRLKDNAELDFKEIGCEDRI